MAIVRYTMENLPPITEEALARMDSIKDEDIDFSDIPQITDFSDFHPYRDRHLYRPMKPRKAKVNCTLDADVVAWLKKDGRGYQTRMNAILRQAMIGSLAAASSAANP
jgi:uncharacterized protein (DUF4415 family)